MIAIVDPVTDEAVLGRVQGLLEPRIAVEGDESVVSDPGELAFADGSGDLDGELHLVGEDGGYAARSGPGLLFAIGDIGDGIGGIVGGSGEVGHL